MSRALIVSILSAFAAIAAGCPGPGDAHMSTTGTTAGTTTIAATSTEPVTPTTTMDVGTSSSTGEQMTTEAPLSCGEPASECANVHRVWCEDFADMCLLAGLSVTDTNYCAILNGMCSTEPACQACFNLANTCKQVGIVTPAECDAVFSDCLCRAAALGLDINA